MSTNANPIVIQPSKELTDAINAAVTPEALQAALVAESARLGIQLSDNARTAEIQAAVDAAKKAEAETAAANKLAAEKAAGEKPFTRQVNIAGKDFEFEAPTELELERMINNALMVAYSVQTPVEETHVEETVDPAVAAKAVADAAAAKAALEVKFRAGEITAAEYIEQSGAMADYLAAQGVPLDALREAVNHTEVQQAEKSWAQATEEFLHSPAGADWPGGEKNLRIIGMQLMSMGLEEAPDKVSALAQAYQAMKVAGTVFPADSTALLGASTALPLPADAAAASAKAAADKAVADKAAADAAAAASVAAARAEAERKTAALSSSLFGMSSGIGAGADAAKAKAVNDLKAEIPASASPEEIIAAWKAKQIEAGQDPNAAFMQTFSRPPR